MPVKRCYHEVRSAYRSASVSIIQQVVIVNAIFTSRAPVILASASPRRQLFLKELGLAYTVVRPSGAEPEPRPGESPEGYARRAAQAKAHAVAAADKNAVIIAADTVVALGDIILGKPLDAADALRMLRLLAGRAHRVISAVCLCFSQSGEEETFQDSAEVRFHPWTEAVLAAYASTGEPMDKAGAYAIQGQGAFLVDSITGSWSTVVGLPVAQLAALLLQKGIIGVAR